MATGAIIAGGALLGGGAGFLQGREQEKQAKKEANNVIYNSILESQAIEEQGEDLEQRQRLLFSASGFSLEGSPALILKDTLEQSHREAALVREGGERTAKGIRRQGKNLKRASIIQGVSGGAKTAGGFI